jgi:SAM-dependent methyltransferase
VTGPARNHPVIGPVDPGQQLPRRRSFDRDPHGYDRARPPYPPEVFDILAAEFGLGPGCRVLEIGPGSGQATAELLARGAEVVAVEPGRGLASVLAGRLPDGRLPDGRLRIVPADFEHAAVPPGPYHLVVSATAFHWLDLTVALPKIARLVSDRGGLAVWWTVFGDPERRTAFRSAVDQLYARWLPGERRGPGHVPGPLRVESWSAELRRGGLFGPVSVDLIRWTHRLTPTGARLLWGSFPNVNELPPAAREIFLDSIADLVDRHGGVVDDPYVTSVYRTRPVPRR